MTTQFAGLGPLERLRLPGPVWGIDPSTLRYSVGILVPLHGDMDPVKGESVRRGNVAVSAETLTLLRHPAWPERISRSIEDLSEWLERLSSDFGRPRAIGLEVPRGMSVPAVSHYAVAAVLAAVGDVWRAEVPVVEIGAGEWKKPATGHGIAPGLVRLPKTAPKLERGRQREANRKIELARIEEWARDVCGWTGKVQDETAGLGIAVATGLRVSR